jgi:hypothetical protein
VRRILLVLGIIVAIVAAVAALNGLVDPKDEFYSGDALSAALSSNCLLALDAVDPRSYLEFKEDLFRRKEPTRVVLASDGAPRPGLQLGFPDFDPHDLLATVRYLTDAVPEGRRLRIAIVTQPDWFDARTPDGSPGGSQLARLGYLLSPATLASSLDLMRQSTTLAFTGWQKDEVGRRCVVDRGSPQPAFRLDGSFPAAAPAAASGKFAWERLTSVDEALTLAAGRGWRVAGISLLRGSDVYRAELKALFAKHGYRWRVRRIAV